MLVLAIANLIKPFERRYKGIYQGTMKVFPEKVIERLFLRSENLQMDAKFMCPAMYALEILKVFHMVYYLLGSASIETRIKLSTAEDSRQVDGTIA